MAEVATALRSELAQIRPEIPCEIAFLGGAVPTVATAVERAAARGANEVVLVPLDLANAIEPIDAVTAVADEVRMTQRSVALAVARPIGPEATLLSVLDARLRSALAAARILELDGLVLSAPTTGDVRGAALLARRARQWSTHHRLPCLVAVADGTGPSVAHAIQGLRSQGRRHIAVGALFWAPDEAYASQADLAHRAGCVAVSEPLGATRELTELILGRYAFAAMDLLDAPIHQGVTLESGDLAASA